MATPDLVVTLSFPREGLELGIMLCKSSKSSEMKTIPSSTVSGLQSSETSPGFGTKGDQRRF